MIPGPRSFCARYRLNLEAGTHRIKEGLRAGAFPNSIRRLAARGASVEAERGKCGMEEELPVR